MGSQEQRPHDPELATPVSAVPDVRGSIVEVSSEFGSEMGSEVFLGSSWKEIGPRLSGRVYDGSGKVIADGEVLVERGVPSSVEAGNESFFSVRAGSESVFVPVLGVSKIVLDRVEDVE